MSKIEKHIEHYPNGEIKEKGTYKNGEKLVNGYITKKMAL